MVAIVSSSRWQRSLGGMNTNHSLPAVHSDLEWGQPWHSYLEWGRCNELGRSPASWEGIHPSGMGEGLGGPCTWNTPF